MVSDTIANARSFYVGAALTDRSVKPIIITFDEVAENALVEKQPQALIAVLAACHRHAPTA